MLRLWTGSVSCGLVAGTELAASTACRRRLQRLDAPMPRAAAAVAQGSQALNAKQRKEMRAHAQRLAKKLVVVQVGKNGLGPGVVQMVDEALTAHEICKVKIYDAAEDTAEAAEVLSQEVGAAVAGQIGGTVLLVRVRKAGAPSALRPMLDALA